MKTPDGDSESGPATASVSATHSAPVSVGRPRSSSRQMLEDAATELFLETSYADTTVDQITQRAGVSRNTFFNYFQAKSDLLWREVDASITALADELSGGASLSLDSIRLALHRSAEGFGANRIPVTFTQDEVMGARDEVVSSGLERVARLAAVLASALVTETDSSARTTLRIQAMANALAGAVAAAWVSWARDGIARGALPDYLGEALEAVAACRS
jgi:AcrR family transcriptional regulator